MTTKRWVAVVVGGALVLGGACTGGGGAGDDVEGAATVSVDQSSADKFTRTDPASAQVVGGAAAASAGTAGGAGGAAATAVVHPAVGKRMPAATDNLSTFAVDVDTGSYTLARKALGLDRLPDPSTVRPEEFVNYFDGGLKRPDGPGFAITVDGAQWPFGEHHLVRIGLATRAISDADRTPVALTVVLDVSGSMADEGKLETAKLAVNKLRSQLRAGDSVKLVTYSDTAREVPIDSLDGLQTESGTNVEAGVRLGYEVAKTHQRAGATSRLVLVSDGVANIGATGPDEILKLVGESAGRGVGLVTVGVGFGEYRDDLLEQLADKGDGFYVYVDDEREIERVLVTRLTSLLQAQAKDAKVQVEFDPAAVKSYRLIGYENRAVADGDFTNDSVDAGEVGPGHTVTALYEVEPVGGAGDLGKVSVRWADPSTGKVDTAEAAITRSAIGAEFDKAAPHLQLAGTVAAFAEALRKSEWAPAGGFAAIRKHTTRLAALIENDADVTELDRLVAKASVL